MPALSRIARRRLLSLKENGAYAIQVGSDKSAISMDAKPAMGWPRTKKQVCIEVDDDLKEVRFLMPLDGATVAKDELVLNYFNGWEEPVIVNYAGELVPMYW